MTSLLSMLDRFEQAAVTYETSTDKADRDELHAARRAIMEAFEAATQQAPLKGVKALEWSQTTETTQAAETILGWYHIDKRWKTGENPVWHWKRSGGQLAPCETEEQAKAAAQADYEARIRSALLPASAEPVKCVACEDSPKAPNIPCAVCGASTSASEREAELVKALTDAEELIRLHGKPWPSPILDVWRIIRAAINPSLEQE